MFDFTEEEKNLLLNLRNNPTKFNETLNKIILEKSKALASPEARKSVYTVQMFDENGNVRVFDVDLPTKLKLEREGKVIDISRPETTIFKKPNAPGNVPRITPAPAAATPAPAPAVTGPAEAFPVPAPTKPQERKTSSSSLFQDVDPTIISSIERYLETKGGGGAELGEPLSYPVEQQARAMPKFEPVASAAPMFKTATDAITPMSAAVSEELPEPLEKPVAEVPEMEPIKTAQVSKIPSISQQRMNEEIRKFKEQEKVRTLQEEEKGFNTSTDEKKAARREAVSAEIIDTVRKDPQLVGYLQEPGVASAFGKLVRDGISMPGGHSIGIRQIEEALFTAVPGRTKADMEKRDRLRTLFEETAFQLSTLIKGQGQVTEFERVLLQQVAGSIANAPGNIIKIHQGLQELAKVDRELGRSYRRSGLPYSDFIRTKDYERIMDGYVQRLDAIRKSPVESLTAPSKAAPGPFSDPAKEKAYQEWRERELRKQNKGNR
jgi:hypothetical protein